MAKPNIRNIRTLNAGAQEMLALSTGGVTILTFGTGLKDADGTSSEWGANLKRVTVKNGNTTTVRRVRGYLLPVSASIADKYNTLFDEQLPPNAILEYVPLVPKKGKDSGFVVVTQDAGTDCFAEAEAVEFF